MILYALEQGLCRIFFGVGLIVISLAYRIDGGLCLSLIKKARREPPK